MKHGAQRRISDSRYSTGSYGSLTKTDTEFWTRDQIGYLNQSSSPGVTIHEPGGSNTGTIRLAAKAFGLYHFCTFIGGQISQGQAIQNQ